MGTRFTLPKRLTDQNLQSEAELAIRETQGVYVTVWRTDNGQSVELPEEGNGEPGAVERIIQAARADRRGYVTQRITDALADDWNRERLGLIAAPAPVPTTYTLAIGGDMLLATVVDGGDITDQLEEFEAPEGGPRFKAGDYEVITGCILTDDKPEDADRIVWHSGNCGWICDTSGRNWRFAIRAEEG